ncbi:MAG: NAD(+) diphosphatase [Actinomycetota bacterium]|nr:NAD(+) diphosphatase [Actinomycetota bacterium]
MSARNQSLSPIDRASDIRTDAAKLALLWRSAKILPVIEGRIGAHDGALRFLNADNVESLSASFESGERYFLGLARDGAVAYFAWRTSWINEPADEVLKFEGFRTLREVGGDLDEVDMTLAVHAVGLCNWHATHPRCSRCGAETVSDLGGSVRVCVLDSSQHHPRTDPAVIVLVKDVADRILLGHQSIWPNKRFSTFAGFVEPGESFEECVSREVFEEAGVYCNDIDYLASQAWPFPASIMIAFQAITDHPDTAKADGVEITQIQWFSRDEMKTAIAKGDLLLPPTISVARKMITTWYTAKSGYLADDLIGGESWRP